MHGVSYGLMQRFVEKYLIRGKAYEVLDVGSLDINGSYRPLYPDCQYTGLDVCEGRNVDVVAEDPYDWKELGDRKFDIVISGQCLEHVEYPWLTMEQIAKRVRPDGYVTIIVPSQGGIHRYPIDTYRYNPDGMTALGRWCGLDVIEITRQEEEHWGDVMAVYKLGELNRFPPQVDRTIKFI